jgi:hypothetical protein
MTMAETSRGAGTGGPLPPEEIWLIASDIARKKGLDPQMVYRMIMQESGGDPTAFNEAENARGLMQMRPGAATDVGLSPEEHEALLGDPWASVDAGTDYLAKIGGDDPRTMLSRYNAGPTGAARGFGLDYADEVLARPGMPMGMGDYSPSSAAPAITAEELAAGSEDPGLFPGAPAPTQSMGRPGFLPDSALIHDMPRPGSPSGQVYGPGPDSMPAGPRADEISVPSDWSPSEAPGEAGGPPIEDISTAPPAPPTASSFPSSVPPPSGRSGGGWKEALKGMALPLAAALSGGKMNPFLSYAIGKQKGEGERRISEWETEQKVKTETEKRDLEQATKIMDELQGFDLGGMMQQVEREYGRDSTQYKALLGASDSIDKISQKYADALDPNGPGGVGITPGEAKELILMRQRFSKEIAAAKTGQTRLSGQLEAEAWGARGGAETDAILDRTKRMWDIEPKVPNPMDPEGPAIPISQALQLANMAVKNAQVGYYSARAGAQGGANKFSLADANNTAKIIPLYEMARVQAEKKGDANAAAFYARQLAVIRQMVREAGGGSGAGMTPQGAGGVDSLIDDQMANYSLE